MLSLFENRDPKLTFVRRMSRNGKVRTYVSEVEIGRGAEGNTET